MDIKNRIWSVVLTTVLIFTSTFVVAFANGEEEEPAGAINEPATEETFEAKAMQAVVTKNPIAVMTNNSTAGIDSKVDNSLKDYRSILIVGTDKGGRADLMIVFSYNKKTNKAKIFSVARDTYMQINNSAAYTIHGKKRDFCKGNLAAEFGGMKVLVKELNRHLDLNIREYVAIDWDGVAKLVDSLGGLENCNIKSGDMLKAINDLITSYGKGETIKSAGVKKLTGWQAVQYLRVRQYTGGNARVREDRNREVFCQLFNKTKSNPALLLKVYSAVSDNIDSNMDIVSALSLAASISLGSTSSYKTDRFPYKYKSYWDPDGCFVYDVMNTNASNVKTLHKNMFGQKKYKLSGTANNLSKKTSTLTKKYLKKSKPLLSKATVTVSGTAYTGKPVTPKVSVTLGDRTLIQGTDYENRNLIARSTVGKYSFTIKGLCDGYEDQSRTVTYEITPPGTNGLVLTPLKKGFTATWQQQAALMPDVHITGYQLQYSLKSSFKSAKTSTVSGYTNVSKTINKLKKKKTYYVRVRTYVTNGSGTHYSDWSSVQKVKTLK